MANLFKSYEIADRFKIPKQTMKRWSDEVGTWRKDHYLELERIHAKELNEKASKMSAGAKQ